MNGNIESYLRERRTNKGKIETKQRSKHRIGKKENRNRLIIKKN